MNLTGQTSFCDEQDKESGDLWMTAWRPPGDLPVLATVDFPFLVLLSWKEEKHWVGSLNLLTWLDLHYFNDSLYAFPGLLYHFFLSYRLPATAPTSETQKYPCLVGGGAHPGPRD